MHQTKVSIAATLSLNRRKYHDLYRQLEVLPDGNALEVVVTSSLLEAKRIRAALQGMARYRGDFKIATSIEHDGTDWLIKIVKQSV